LMFAVPSPSRRSKNHQISTTHHDYDFRRIM
jgi:hypothetical protein